MSKSFKETAAKVVKPFRMIDNGNGLVIKREFNPDGSYKDTIAMDDEENYYFGALYDIPH